MEWSIIIFKHFLIFARGIGGGNEIVPVRKADCAIDTSCSEIANWVKTPAQKCSHMLALPFHLC